MIEAELLAAVDATQADRLAAVEATGGAIRPYRNPSAAVAAMIEEAVAGSLATATGRPEDSADIVACARAVAALPIMRLAHPTNWIFPVERSEHAVDGLVERYRGGFAVRFPLSDGPYAFGSTGALAEAVGFTGPKRTDPINSALNPKATHKSITTRRAWSPPGAGHTDPFPAGTRVTVTRATKGGPVQATFETWSAPVAYTDAEAAHAALLGPETTNDQQKAFRNAANPADLRNKTFALGVDVVHGDRVYPAGTRARPERTEAAVPKAACVLAINLATKKVILGSYHLRENRWQVHISAADARDMDPAGFEATYGGVEDVTMFAGTLIGRVGHYGTPFFVDPERPEIDHIGCDPLDDRVENTRPASDELNSENRDPPRSVRTPAITARLEAHAAVLQAAMDRVRERMVGRAADVADAEDARPARRARLG